MHVLTDQDNKVKVLLNTSTFNPLEGRFFIEF